MRQTYKMKKKFMKTLALGLSLATALTLTTGCGKKKDSVNDTIATTESRNNGKLNHMQQNDGSN